MHPPTTKVYRQQVQEGFSIPAIIRNGSYFFVDLDVYENGRVYCWNFEDFASFQRDVHRGWVVLQVPDGEALSVHGLGEWRIDHGEWQFNPQTFIAYVEALIRVLNPGWHNIHTHHERRVNGVVIGESGNGTVYKKDAPTNFFSERIDGASINLFYRQEAAYWLVRVNVFADGTLHLARLDAPVELTLDALEHLVQEHVVLTQVPPGATVRVHGLGQFTVAQELHAVSVRNKLLEIRDIQRTLAGEPTSIQCCREAYEAYAAQPTASRRDALREAYERVPEHLKRYVGDMDIKDTQVRMVLYGEQEIEGWSHRQAAQALGEELPTIGLPKPEAE